MKRLYPIILLFIALPLSAQESNEDVQNGDSAIFAPLQVQSLEINNYDDLTQTPSSFDLQQPENIKTSVEYDPITGYYVVHTRIGDIDISTPYLMTDQEYKNYSERQQMGQYWQQKVSTVEHDNERKFDITDMKFNIGPADKVFGPGGVQLKLQGSAELLFGFKHQYVNNPALTQRSRNNNIFNFDEKIQVNVNGKVGDKLNFNMSYNTESSFDFDQQNIKLNYKGKEDDIIQSIEAGNVSMNLNSSLIRGSTALFGVKTDLKFGKLKVQALISQQNSESQTVSGKGGAQTTSFEVPIDNYDENRHFFLSYYFRDNYEQAMLALPYVASGVTINRIEVWVTNKRGNYEQARNIVALTDLGENDPVHILNSTQWAASPDARTPYNKANSLYQTLTAEHPEVRDIQYTSAIMQTLTDMESGEDYEKIESARLLSSSEYTLNSTLGYISLKAALNQDEVLAVAYEYTYAGQVYQVGEFSTDAGESLKAPNALLLKLLKSTNNAPSRKNKGTWDLMMKNIYSIGASQMSEDKFELYIQYRNDSVGTDVQYLMEGNIRGKQLLRVMGLDRLDTRNNPHPDGKFDYVEGYTAISNTGRIIFPVLEPFGSHLAKEIGNPTVASKYVFQELYDSTLVIAQEMSEKNKFTLIGKYKGSAGNEIRLNAMNVPRGSVVVTAGGATLIENVDYTVDYTMGTVTIINQSVLESGTNVEVKLENQSLFSMQRKALYGVHLEYEFNKDLTIGGTLMHLREKPLTTKVNTGSEPLANTIWGVNANWKTDMQWLTLLLDKIPWVNATAPSSFSLNAEFAHLIPGHTRDVGQAGTAYIDDFEATKTNIDIHYPNYWKLASTPRGFEEYNLTNDIGYNKNRALLAWYTVDPIFGYPQTNTPKHIKDNPDLMSDHRTRIVDEQELYPNKVSLANSNTKLSVLNLSFYPEERGPYNISATEIGTDGKLTNPKSRWGGMMRKLDNTDFEKANIEYIEFWLMDPLLTNADGNYTGGDLYIDLGDVSEDILRDGKKSFEHGLPLSEDNVDALIERTLWGRVPRTTSTTIAFSNEAGARAKQDVGLDGLSNEQELTHSYNGVSPYADYVATLRAKVNPEILAMWQDDPFSPLNDPAGDDYHYYRGEDFDAAETPILERYKHFNGTEGNSPEMNDRDPYGTASTLQPDIEDINQDNTLNDNERFYRYHVSLRPTDLAAGKQNIASVMETNVTLRNGQTVTVRWYQFKIPLRGDAANTTTIGNIRNFKSIRFARLFLTNFEHETHFRLATLDLVRGEWRNYTKGLYQDVANNQYNIENPYASVGSLDVQAVNIEENANRVPVNYVLPPGISRQTDPGQATLIPQNEQAMVLRVHSLSPKDARSVYKNVSYDMRQYKRLQMFVHAEALPQDPNPVQDKQLTCFIRLGSDLKNNYYEYEIPLDLTPQGTYSDNSADRLRVWLPENTFDFPLSVLTDAKTARNKAKRSGNTAVANAIPYEMYDPENLNNKITVLGNPTLENVETIMIGVRNISDVETSGEIWVNELRLSQFNEQGGVAAMANAALSVSDIAQFNIAGRLETAGYGSIESNVLDRNTDNTYQISVSAALEAGRLFPEKAKLQIPLYVSYSNETLSPQYDPLDTDIKLSESLENYETNEERDSIRLMANTVQESTGFSVTNMKVDIHSKKRNMFYDPANFSISASYNQQNQHTPEMEKDVTTDHKGSFNYSYNFNPQPWEPFKDVKKVAKVKLLKEFNIYYLPQSWAFNTNMHRTFTHMKMRDFNTSTEPGSNNAMDLTFSKDFTWDRNFDFKYDLTKNLKFSFQTAMNSTVDEGYYAPEILKDYAFTNDFYEAWKDTIQRSLAKWGTPYTYQQLFSASWNVPFNRIPYLEAMTANASYNATYNWNRTVQSSASTTYLGNIVSSTRAWQADGGINFETLYGKSKYWKQISQRYGQRARRGRAFKPKTYTETISVKAGEATEITHRLGSQTIKATATTNDGKAIKIKCTPVSTTKAAITAPQDIDKLSVTITTQDPNQRSAGQVTLDMAAYFGTMIRKLQITYRQTNSMTIPGFAPQAGFMGQQRYNDMYAPGFDFAFGGFNDDFVQTAKERGWLSADTSIVQPATRSVTNDFDVKLTLEPFPGFKVQLNGKRYAAQSTSIIYSYEQLQENMTGSFNITQVAIATAFQRIGNAESNFSSTTFNQFLSNRDILTSRVQQQYENINYPDAGFIPSQLRGHQYNRQIGNVGNTTADVLVPAFLAAYTGRDASTIGLNPFLSILQVLPNWSVTFDGLGRLPWIRDNFRSVNLTHAYTCKYAIGSYSTFSTWVPAGALNNKQVGFIRDVESGNPIPSSAYDISSVNISESFSPLIGLNLTMKNSLSAKFEYRKQRNISLNVTSVQISEGHTDEFVIGAGYTIKNLNFITKTKNGGQKKVSNDLKLNVDISYKDIKTLLRKVEDNITQASAGNKVFAIKISADYVLSQKINLQLFYDHQGTTPLISSSYPIKMDNVGINIKLMLTR